MDIFALIVAIIALLVAILAYQKVGGLGDLKKQIDQRTSSVDLRKSIDSLSAATETLREKTAEAIEKLENTLRGLDKQRRRSPRKDAPSQPEREKTDEQS